MEALQTEILGWLGYLDRWSVSWQVAFILLVAIAVPVTRRSTSLFKNNSTLAIGLAPVTLLSTAMLLSLIKIPSGIILQAGLFWGLFSTVDWIESRLKANNPKNQLGSYLSKIVRPAILIWAITYFIERLSSLSAISIITIGSFSNTDFTIGSTFTLAIGLYPVSYTHLRAHET